MSNATPSLPPSQTQGGRSSHVVCSSEVDDELAAVSAAVEVRILRSRGIASTDAGHDRASFSFPLKHKPRGETKQRCAF